MHSLATIKRQESAQLRTHNINEVSDLTDFDLLKYQEILMHKPPTCLPADVTFDLLIQLAQFELGRFLLKNKGLNGYWTAYVIIHGPQMKNLHPLEKWILHAAPTVKATQERFEIFREILQKHLRSDMHISSIPCGLMDDLLSLNYRDIDNVLLTGVDLDTHSILGAQENAKKYGLKNVNFHQKDAWKLDVDQEYDMITSNGLNIYEQDDSRVVALYQQFYQALKPGGLLVTSFLTPPPALSSESTWKNVNMADALKQKAIFSDIVDVTWQAFRTENQVKEQLEKAGLEVLDIIYDAQGIFPTILARRGNISS